VSRLNRAETVEGLYMEDLLSQLNQSSIGVHVKVIGSEAVVWDRLQSMGKGQV
jgi:hypothetical protein